MSSAEILPPHNAPPPRLGFALFGNVFAATLSLKSYGGIDLCLEASKRLADIRIGRRSIDCWKAILYSLFLRSLWKFHRLGNLCVEEANCSMPDVVAPWPERIP